MQLKIIWHFIFIANSIGSRNIASSKNPQSSRPDRRPAITHPNRRPAINMHIGSTNIGSSGNPQTSHAVRRPAITHSNRRPAINSSKRKPANIHITGDVIRKRPTSSNTALENIHSTFSQLPEGSMEAEALKKVAQGELKLPEIDTRIFSDKIIFGKTKNNKARTADSVSVTSSTKDKWETEAASKVAKALELDGSWVKVSTESFATNQKTPGKALKIMHKNNEILLLEHSTPETGFGVFEHSTTELTNLLQKFAKRKDIDIKSIKLLGCCVPPQFAKDLANSMQTTVNTLPSVPDSKLNIPTGNPQGTRKIDENAGVFAYFQEKTDDGGNIQRIPIETASGYLESLLNNMTEKYEPSKQEPVPMDTT